MKIFINNKVYVSQKDIWFLLRSNVFNIPENIIKEICPFGTMAIDKTKENDFFVFESKEAKNYFRKQESIINYNSYKDIGIDEIRKIIDDNSKKALNTSLKLRVVSNLEVAKILYRELVTINFINESLYDLIDFKKGLLRIELPERIRKNPDEKYKVFLKKMMEPIRYN